MNSLYSQKNSNDNRSYKQQTTRRVETMRNLVTFIAAVFALLLAASTVAALPTVEQIRINGNVFESGDQLVVERGEDIDIRVRLSAPEDLENIELVAEILGYEYNDRRGDLYDRTRLFDMEAGDVQFEDLALVMPTDADRDHYDLRVRVGDRTGPSEEYLFRIRLSGERTKLVITDVTFNPSDQVMSGRAFLGQVRVENIGDRDQRDVKVMLSMPQVGATASDYIDRIEPDESERSSDLFLRVPECLETGMYDVVATIEYDRGYETASFTTQIRVTTDAEMCEKPEGEDRVLIEVQPPKAVEAGKSVVFPVMVTNTGSRSQTLVVSLQGADDFGSARVTPSAFIVVPAGGRSTAYVEVTADADAAEGTKVLSLGLATADGQQLGTSSVPVTITAAERVGFTGNWQRVLEISLLVLVVVLIVLGIIVAVSRMRDDERNGGEGSQAYY